MVREINLTKHGLSVTQKQQNGKVDQSRTPCLPVRQSVSPLRVPCTYVYKASLSYVHGVGLRKLIVASEKFVFLLNLFTKEPMKLSKDVKIVQIREDGPFYSSYDEFGAPKKGLFSKHDSKQAHEAEGGGWSPGGPSGR